MRRAVVAAAAVALVAAASARAGVIVKRAASGDVRAQLSYLVRADVYSRIRLTVTRAGTTRLSTRLSTGCPGCVVAGPTGPAPLRVRDLDGDGEQEVLVDMYSGGAHCCTSALVYRWDGARYRRNTFDWGNVGYRIADLDRDGRPELRSGDDRFAAAFTAYAASAFPIRIWRYDAGRRVDVTRGFPALVRADAAQQWRLYRRIRRSSYVEVRGALAAWLADEYLLGRGAEGWKHLNAAFRRGELGRTARKDGYPAGRAYLAALRSFLRRTGYAG